LLKTMLAIGDEYSLYKESLKNYARDAMSQGFPIVFGPMTIAAFDWVSDIYRGMRGSMLDMYRVPEKLKDLVDMFTPYTIVAPMLLDIRLSAGEYLFPCIGELPDSCPIASSPNFTGLPSRL
jgi:hypothetical protein